MIYLSQFSNKKVLVLGLGRTGMSVVLNLLHCYCKQIIVHDDNPDAINKVMQANDVYSLLFKNAYNEKIFNFQPKLHSLKDIEYIIVSPGIDHIRHPLVKQAKRLGIKITNDIEEFTKATAQNQQIAITGTNGKSTTCSLIHHVLFSQYPKAQLGGNIGKPVIDLIYYKDQAKYVMELSSFQIELLNEARFDVIGLLNITPDHLDRYQTFSKYLEAKRKIFNHIKANGLALIGYDCLEVRKIYDKLSKENLPYKLLPLSYVGQLDHGVSLIDGVIYDNFFAKGAEVKLKIPPSLLGTHNAQNLLFAYATAKKAGLTTPQFLRSIKNFKGLEHRAEIFHQTGNLRFINDSKATNSHAMIQSVASFNNIILIVGGVVKDHNFDLISKHKHRVSKVYVIGQDRKFYIDTLSKLSINFEDAATLENAISKIKKQLEGNLGAYDIVLSPAAASFDQFKNFEHRGDEFKKLIREFF